MLCRAFISSSHFQELPVVPRPAEQRYAHRVFPAAEIPRGNGNLRQSGEGALLARAWLSAVAHEPALVRVRTRDVSWIEQGISVLLIHEIDEYLPERLATGDELASGRFEGLPRGCRCQGGLKPFYAGRSQLCPSGAVLRW